MKPTAILISGTYDNLAGTEEGARGSTEFNTCDRADATHVSVFLCHGEDIEPVADYRFTMDDSSAYASAQGMAYANALSMASELAREYGVEIKDTYQLNRFKPKVKMVLAHKHTCANVQPGSTSADVCDCGAVVDGKPVEVRETGLNPAHAEPYGQALRALAEQIAFGALGIPWRDTESAARLVAEHAATLSSTQHALTVWCGPMPESNGKSNFTAILRRKEAGSLLDGLTSGITLARSEYPERVRYEADRVRYLLGELANEPCILDYDADKHSGYVHPDRFEQMAVSKGYIIAKDKAGEYLSDKTRYLHEGWKAARSTW